MPQFPSPGQGRWGRGPSARRGDTLLPDCSWAVLGPRGGGSHHCPPPPRCHQGVCPGAVMESPVPSGVTSEGKPTGEADTGLPRREAAPAGSPRAEGFFSFRRARSSPLIRIPGADGRALLPPSGTGPPARGAAGPTGSLTARMNKGPLSAAGRGCPGGRLRSHAEGDEALAGCLPVPGGSGQAGGAPGRLRSLLGIATAPPESAYPPLSPWLPAGPDRTRGPGSAGEGRAQARFLP